MLAAISVLLMLSGTFFFIASFGSRSPLADHNYPLVFGMIGSACLFSGLIFGDPALLHHTGQQLKAALNYAIC